MLIFCIGPFNSQGQDFTGTWKGYIGGGQQVLLVLTGNGDTLVGYTYDRMDKGHCKANFKGTYNAAKKQLKGEGLDFIENTGNHYLCVYKLTYRPDGDTDYLEGKIGLRPKDMRKLNVFSPGNIRLRRISKTVDTTAYMADWWKSRQAKAGKE